MPFATAPEQKSAFDFGNTAIAFASRSNGELRRAEQLFSLFSYPWLIKYGPVWAEKALKLGLPIKFLIKNTIFAQFCGGEDIAECQGTIQSLARYGIGTILDYSAEGLKNEQGFDETEAEIARTIAKAAGNPDIPFSVFKTTGIARFELLEKISGAAELTPDEQSEWRRAKKRFMHLCQLAAENHVRLFIDAEETWIQPAIDALATEAMQQWNRQECLIYNTLQMYRNDRLDYLVKDIAAAREGKYKVGYKIVRGAYMEKERMRAAAMSYPSPINPDKEATDKAYDDCVELCIKNIDLVSICAGTHNEQSTARLMALMAAQGIDNRDKRVYFSQLLGMSDHISYNLAAVGYNVAKYVPYGPVAKVLPYLTRRAEENSSIRGQAGRELGLIRQEMSRRKQTKKSE